MKKLLVLILLSSSVFAWVPMSRNVMKKSLTMSRPAWTDLCVQDRRNIYCGGKRCDAEIGWHSLCWNLYPKAQYQAYRSK